MLIKPDFISKAAVSAAALLLSAALIACGTTPPSRFYVLSAANGRDDGRTVLEGEQDREGPHVGIRRVEVPEYLRRNEMVFRKSGAEVELAVLHRWAEPLRDSIPRILAENLSVLLETDRVSVYPWPGGTPPRYEISVRIVRLDAGADGMLDLVAHWRLTTAGAGGEPVRRKAVIRLPVDGGARDYSRIAATHSTALEQLSGQMAAVIEERSASGF